MLLILLISEKAKQPVLLPGIFCAIIILFIIAWDVTEVKPNRLIERLDDAKIVATRIVNPDYFTCGCQWCTRNLFLGLLMVKFKK